MADSATELATLHPPFTTKTLLMAALRQNIEPNCPAAADLLLRIAHTDLAGSGSMTGGDTVTPSSFGL